jgi:hypothetical protein
MAPFKYMLCDQSSASVCERIMYWTMPSIFLHALSVHEDQIAAAGLDGRWGERDALDGIVGDGRAGWLGRAGCGGRPPRMAGWRATAEEGAAENDGTQRPT